MRRNPESSRRWPTANRNPYYDPHTERMVERIERRVMCEKMKLKGWNVASMDWLSDSSQDESMECGTQLMFDIDVKANCAPESSQVSQDIKKETTNSEIQITG